MSHSRIIRDPKIMMGKPVVAGTRITVEHLLRCLAAGDSVEHLLANDPHLTVEDIRAAQANAADYLAPRGSWQPREPRAQMAPGDTNVGFWSRWKEV